MFYETPLFLRSLWHFLQRCLFLLVCGALVTNGAVAGGAYQRVVSTNLCADEYVFRLVPREHIAALSYMATDRHPQVSTIAGRAAGLRTIHPTAESVMALHPDVVVMYGGVDLRLHQTLARLGVPVIDVPWADSLADIRIATTRMGGALGNRAGAAALLKDMDAKLAAVRAKAPASPVRTIFYQPNGYVRTSTYTDEILSAAGGLDLSTTFKPTPRGTVPVETVVAAAPDLLILGGESETGSALAYRALHHPAFRSLQGRTLMRFEALPQLLCGGPWVADAAGPFSALVHGALAQKSPGH